MSSARLDSSPPAISGQAARNGRCAANIRGGAWSAIGLPPAPAGRPRLALGRLHTLTLAILVAVVIAAIYGIVRIERGGRWEHQLVAWSTCGMLVSLAILMLLMGRYLLQRALHHVEHQLRTLAREDRLDPIDARVPRELQATLAALEAYVGRVRERMERLCLQKKELDLQMRTAQAERRHSEAIILSISDAVLVVDTFGELALANPAAEKMFGFTMDQARHRPIDRLLQDPALAALIHETRLADPPADEAAGTAVSGCDIDPATATPLGQRGRLASRQVEYSRLSEGQVQTYIITLARVLDDNENPRGVVAVFHDITRQREMAQIKSDFVSAVSHELRTPLSSLKAYVEMLLDGEAADESTRQEFYRIIDAETDRLQRLINKVLDISRIESGVIDIRRTRIHPHEVIRQVLEMAAPQAREKQLALETQLGEGLPPIEADRDLLYQAIQNVVSNAIKYTPSGGRVRLQTGVDPIRGHFTISVADTGIGISREDLPRIFEKFFRSRDGVAMARGTGLGLNLAREIVETVHGGSIDVSSEYGAGTTFVLRLPLATVGRREPAGQLQDVPVRELPALAGALAE